MPARRQSSVCHGVKVRSRLAWPAFARCCLAFGPRLHLDSPWARHRNRRAGRLAGSFQRVSTVSHRIRPEQCNQAEEPNMSNTDTSNQNRVKHARAAVFAYLQAKGLDTHACPLSDDEALIDLLTDLRHYAAAFGIDYERMSEQSETDARTRDQNRNIGTYIRPPPGWNLGCHEFSRRVARSAGGGAAPSAEAGRILCGRGRRSPRGGWSKAAFGPERT
jgi:hypothetical protein